MPSNLPILFLVFEGRANEVSKERMRPAWFRFEFRMELNTHHPRMVFNFGDLAEDIVMESSRDHKSIFFKLVFKNVVELKPMAVTFGNLFCSISFFSFRSHSEIAIVGAQAH